MKRSLLIIACFLIFNASMALSYSVDNVKIIAFPGESLEYHLNLFNNDSLPVQVYINKLFLENVFGSTSIDVSPSINQLINPGESKVINIRIPVNSELALGVYRTVYSTSLLMSYAGVTERVPIDAVILTRDSYSAGIPNVSLIIPSNVNPLNEFNVTVTALVNVNQVSPVFKTVVSGDSGIIFESSVVRELVYGINIFDVSIKLPDRTFNDSYLLTVNAELSGALINQGSGLLKVISYSKVDFDEVTSEGFFGKSIIKAVSNEGTESVNALLNYSASLIEPLLVSKSVITVRRDGLFIESFNVAFTEHLINESVILEPGMSAELIVEFNYAILIALPFILMLSFIGWFFFTKKVSVIKEVIECRKEDNELMVKVAISVRNVSLKSISDVKIIDDLPVYANKAGGFGSIKGEINKDKGTVTFNAGRLDPKEEILISYKFKTDVELEGRISLPPASIKFISDGKVVIIKSGTPTIRLIKG